MNEVTHIFSAVNDAWHCLQACVPKETRKAIQLFKRGAGASDEEPTLRGSEQPLNTGAAWLEECRNAPGVYQPARAESAH